MGRAVRPRGGRGRAAALTGVALGWVMVALGGAAALAGCGSSGALGATTTTTYHPLQPPPASRNAPTRTATARTAPTFPPVGTTQRVRAGTATLSVTIQQLLNPLGGSHAALLPHTHAVGVLAVIRNEGPGTYDSSSTADFSIVPSAGTATPVFARAGACRTPLRDWDNQISPGEARDGCVVFALPSRAKVAQVRFSPHAHVAGRATWSVGR